LIACLTPTLAIFHLYRGVNDFVVSFKYSQYFKGNIFMLSSFYPCIEYFGFVLFPVFKVIIAAIKVTMYLMEFASNLHGVFCVLQFHRQIEADCNDITEILFKVALSTNILSQPSSLSPSLLLVCDNCCMPPATKL
jgi:hypothetical protein